MFITSYSIKAQSDIIVDKWIDYLEQLNDETTDDGKIEALYAELSFLTEHPFPINKVTQTDLERLPFLSDYQIASLLNHRDKYGRFISIHELKLIDGFDKSVVDLLFPFIYIDQELVENIPITVNNLFKKGKNTLNININRCFQQKRGYGSYPDSILSGSPNKTYLGEPYYQSVRYSYQLDNRIQFGVIAEKDAGESFWNKTHKGYDYYSAHIVLKSLISWLKTLVLGDYKISFGQGLILSQDYSPGRTSLVTQAERRSYGFRRHFSTNESDFFRGSAVAFQLKSFDIQMFYSFRKLDGTVDSTSITSFKTDGLHRLIREREKQRTITMHTLGSHLRFQQSWGAIGISGLYYGFPGLEVMPSPSPYNIYYFRGSAQSNFSVDYLWRNSRLQFYGETAYSANGAFATLNGLKLTPTSYFTLLLMYRYYDKKYQAFFANAFGQQTRVQNEEGLYLGLSWTVFPHWKLSSFVDYYRFPWLRYGVDKPSDGLEYMVQAEHSPVSSFSAYLRYKYRDRESYQQHQLRYQQEWKTGYSFLLRTSIDGILYRGLSSKQALGGMISQSVGWKNEKYPFSADAFFALFCTDDYNSRIYSYEKNLLYQYYRPTLFGEGFRTTFVCKWQIINKLQFSAKWAWSHYFQAETIGSDLELIEGKNKMDMFLGLQWKF